MSAPSAGLSSGTVRRIHEVGRLFEERRRRKESPSIEDHLSQFAVRERPSVLYCLLSVELKMQQAEGRLPRAADYVERFTDYAAVVSQVFAEVADIDDNATTQPWSIRLDRLGRTRPLPKIGETVDRFEIRSVLGEGGFGTVFRAYDPQLEREVAIKIARLAFWQTSEECQQRLEEARAAAILTHPNICPIYEVGGEQERPYIVMAWINGQPLSQLITDGGISEENAIVLLIRQVALTMEEAHRSGTVHRDLKPANILIDNRGNPILTDFGLAARTRPGGNSKEFAMVQAGTLYYMSPEQVRGDVVGPSTDIYSLGVTFYELLAGRRPFVGSRDKVLKQILEAEPSPPSVFRPKINSLAESICLKALRKNPADRFESMREMAEALREVLKFADPVELFSHVDKLTLSGTTASSTNVAKTATENPNDRTWHRGLLVCLALLIVPVLSGMGLFLARSVQSTGTIDGRSTHSPDHDAAQWLVSINAKFDVQCDEQTPTVTRPDEIPQRPFHIVRVDLTNQPNLRDEHLAHLQSLEMLQTLLLHDTPLTDAGLVHIQNLDKLKVLWIDRTQVTDAGIVHLQKLRNLESLSLNDTVVTASGLSHLSNHPSLTRLSLKRSQVDDEGILGVCNLTSLTHLWLDGTRLTDEGLEALAGLENLGALMLGELHIEGHGLRHLSGLPKLEQLGLKRTRLHDQGMHELGVYPALTHFYADATALGDEGLRNLVEAAPQLVRLSIGQTRVTNSGLEHLAKLPKLEALSLDKLRLNPDAIEILASLPKLKYLSLQFARIGDKHAPALSQLTQLERLYVGGTRLSREGRQCLAAELSDCEIQ